MNKLIKLLNQFEKERLIKIGCEIDEDVEYYGRSLENGKIVNWSYDPDAHNFLKYYIISKDYEFIKWLVDNSKIDRLTFCTVETPSSKYEDFDLLPETPREDYTNILLMDLAIQDNPIEFLINVLKD